MTKHQQRERCSDNGGTGWTVDANLRAALTENGAFPVDIASEAGSGQTLLRDMAFDSVEAGRVFATGPAGVFATLDGLSWRRLWVVIGFQDARRCADRP